MQSYKRCLLLLVTFFCSSVFAGTSLHFSSGLAGGNLGFNLADISSVDELNALPSGQMGLVWLGMCGGADTAFVNAVTPFIGNPKLFGFYLMDEPDPTGIWNPLCTPANLKAESDWIHAHVPGAKTFFVMMNLGTNASPSYVYNGKYYSPSNTDIDLFGIDYYPCLSEYGTCRFDLIGKAVAAAQAVGVSINQIVPVYQAFGCASAKAASGCGDDNNGYTFIPTAAELQQTIDTWASLVPNPLFDYAYSWSVSDIQYPLSGLPDLQTVIAVHNSASVATPSPSPTPSPTPTPTPSPSPSPTPAPPPPAASGNLVTNPGYESKLSGWNVWANSKAVTSPVYAGAYSLRVSGKASGVYQDITAKLIAGSTYTLSVEAKLGSSKDQAAEIGIEYLDANGNVIFDQHVKPISSAWSKFSFSFKFPAGVKSALIYVYKGAGSSYVYADNFSVVAN